MELEELSWDLPLWQDEQARQLLVRFCVDHGIPESTLYELIAIERKHQHRVRAAGIYDEIDAVLERIPALSHVSKGVG